jgi:hypothetical protein
MNSKSTRFNRKLKKQIAQIQAEIEALKKLPNDNFMQIGYLEMRIREILQQLG